MALDPLYFAAIGAGLLAIVVVIAFLIHRGLRRSSTTSRSVSTSRSPHASPFAHGAAKTTGSTGASGFLGYPPSPPQPNTASSHDSASPPSTGRLKKSNSAPRRPGDLRPLSPRIGMSEREEESEMVMVTYEEGLKKLGLDRTQHIIYPDPPTFDDNGEIATPPFSSQTQSSRPTPTTASLLTPGKTGAMRPGYGRQHSDSPLRNKYSLSPTTRLNTGRAEETGRFPTDSELMSTGVPSYYHDTSHGRYRLEEPE